MKKWLAPQKKHTQNPNGSKESCPVSYSMFVFCGSYLISRALGPKLGGAVGCMYYLGVLLLSVLEVITLDFIPSPSTQGCKRNLSLETLSLRYILAVSLDVPVVLVVVYMLHKASTTSKCIHLIL
jgi:hypothetical protein